MVNMKRIVAAFYESSTGKVPVREWLLSLDKADRQIIGEDIATVECGWPVGMPVCRPLGQQCGKCAARSPATGSRAFFFQITGSSMVILHGFVKKTQKTPPADLALARKRMKEIEQ